MWLHFFWFKALLTKAHIYKAQFYPVTTKIFHRNNKQFIFHASWKSLILKEREREREIRKGLQFKVFITGSSYTLSSVMYSVDCMDEYHDMKVIIVSFEAPGSSIWSNRSRFSHLKRPTIRASRGKIISAIVSVSQRNRRLNQSAYRWPTASKQHRAQVSGTTVYVWLKNSEPQSFFFPEWIR